jgi:metallo-beta-lactamase family protein
LVRDGQLFKKVDYLICESTYGGRKHKVERSAEEEMLDYITQTCVNHRGRLVIPAFSVGRTQSVVFTINQLKKQGLIPSHLKVFVDSPLAVKTTGIYQRYSDILNEEAQNFMAEHGSLFEFEGAEYLDSMDEHDELLHYYDPCVIISAAGMVEGGRIQEHVSNNIENPFSTILIAGFCAEGTLGHRLLLGQSLIRIKNRDRRVFAKISQTDVFSSHPDHDEVFNYISKTITPNSNETVFLIHGEETQLSAMKNALHEVGIKKVEIPDMMQEYII